MLRKKVSLGLTVCIIFLMISCGPSTGTIEAFKISVSDGSSIAAAKDSRGFYEAPDGVKIAFTKIWFPAGSAYSEIISSEYAVLPVSGGVSTIKEGFPTENSKYFKALDEVMIFDATIDQVIVCSTLPAHGTKYNGVLIEYNYFEMNVGDYSIRFHTQDHDEYKRKDVSIKYSGNNWNNNYAYWEHRVMYNYVHEESSRNISRVIEYDFENEHKYEITDETYELVVKNIDPGDYDTRLDGPTGPQDIVDARIKAGKSPHPANDVTEAVETLRYSLAGNNQWGETGSLYSRFLIGGHKDENLYTPHFFETDPVDANTAKNYIYGITFDLQVREGRNSGLNFDIDDIEGKSFSDFDTFEELVSVYDGAARAFTICPITGAIEVAVGWEDFEGGFNGGYYYEGGDEEE